MGDGGGAIGSTVCHVVEREGPCVCGLTHPAEVLVANVPKSEALGQPLPISANLDKSCFVRQRSENSRSLVVRCPFAAIVSPASYYANLQRLHRPTEDTEQLVECAKA